MKKIFIIVNICFSAVFTKAQTTEKQTPPPPPPPVHPLFIIPPEPPQPSHPLLLKNPPAVKEVKHSKLPTPPKPSVPPAKKSKEISLT